MSLETLSMPTLAQLGQIPTAEAQRLFSTQIRVQCDPKMRGNKTYRLAAAFSVDLLSKTFPNVSYDDFTDGSETPIRIKMLKPNAEPRVILNFGGKAQFKTATVIHANCRSWIVHVDSDQSIEPDKHEKWNPVLALITGCYAAARTAAHVFGAKIDTAESLSPFSILDFKDAAVDFNWDEPLTIGETHMAGIGAVGSAALLALGVHGVAAGKLILVDHDVLDATNLERYCIFEADDRDKFKVNSAKSWLERRVPKLEVLAVAERMQKYVTSSYDADLNFKIPRLISAPDRRDTRREFQSMLPAEVFDASTGPNELIIHHNTFKPEQACLCCIYPPDPSEDAHFKHVAEALNIPVVRIKSGDLISGKDANQIRQRYPELALKDLVNRPFDTVFRQLCSAGQIRLQAGDEIVISPFPFISALAGVLLYFELVKTVRLDRFGAFQNHNYIRLNPFFNPNPSLRTMYPASHLCPVCKNPAIQRAFAKLWHK